MSQCTCVYGLRVVPLNVMNLFCIPILWNYGYLAILLRLWVLAVPVPYGGMFEEECGLFAKYSR